MQTVERARTENAYIYAIDAIRKTFPHVINVIFEAKKTEFSGYKLWYLVTL